MQEKSLFCWHWSFKQLRLDFIREVVISLTVVVFADTEVLNNYALIMQEKSLFRWLS